MKKHSMYYEDLNKCMIRMPVMTFEFYQEVFSNDNFITKEKLKEICNNKIFKEGILSSSIELYYTMEKFINGEEIKKYQRFKESILKYVKRMTSRPTPFGMCSAISIIDIENKDSVNFDKKFVKYARPDMEWLIKVVKLFEEKYRYTFVKYTSNNGIYYLGDRAFINMKIKGINDSEEVEELFVRATKAFKLAINSSKQPIRYAELLNIIIREYNDIDEKIVKNFIDELIEKEFLIPTFRPSLTIKDQFEYILYELASCGIDDEIKCKLDDINNYIKEYNGSNVGEGIEMLIKIIKSMNEIVRSDTPVQIDTKAIVGKNSTIDKKIISEVNELMELLYCISDKASENNKPLQEYKIDFIEKYGENQEVSLCTLLDNDIGIGAPRGYNKPLNNRRFVNELKIHSQNDLESWFMDKYYNAVKNNTSIVLDLDEIKIFCEDSLKNEELFDSFELNMFIREKKDGSRNIYLGPNLGSGSAGKTFGRFSYFNNENNVLFDLINHKEKSLLDKDTVICELTFIPPSSRYSNVTRNYSNRDFELALNTNYSKEEDLRIDIKDLVVGIDKGQFYIRSMKLGKKILFRSNNMLNPMMISNMCRFLFEVSLDGKRNWGDLKWNEVYKNFTYIPEIRFKSFILRNESWIIYRYNENLRGNKLSYEEFKENITKFKKENNMPDLIYISEADNRLLINLLNNDSLMILFNSIKRSSSERIVLEAFEQGKDILLDEKEESRITEVCIPFIKRKLTESQKESLSMNINEKLNISNDYRNKVPFNEWIFFKLYGISKRSDEFITKCMSSLCDKLIDKKLIDKYFFIRYIDERPHIRLRFHSSSDLLLKSYPIIQEEFNKWIEIGIISSYSISTYEREVERYGGVSLIEYAENIFFYDSIVVQKLLDNKIRGRLTIDSESLGVLSIISYLEDFGYTFSEQLDLIRSNTSPYKYRDDFKKIKKNLFNLFSNKKIEDNNFYEDIIKIKEILSIRSESIKNYRKKIDENQNKLTNNLNSIALSIIHLHCNRLFGINREYEEMILTLTGHLLYSLKYIKERIE